MTSLGLSSAPDVITLDQNWHHLYSTSAGKKDLSSDWPIGALNMHQNAQKVDRKTRSQISWHYTWLLHGKNWQPWWLSLKHFLTPSKPGRRPITAAKRKPKEKKAKKKTFQKSKSLKLDFCACLGQNVLNTVPVARTASCCVANAFSIRLKLVRPRSSLKITKYYVKKMKFWQKVPGVNGLIYTCQLSRLRVENFDLTSAHACGPISHAWLKNASCSRLD